MIGGLFGSAERDLQLYSNAYVLLNGALLTQESSVSVEKKSNSTPTYTLAMGFAGLSQGAGIIEINIENAVPSKDFEFHPDLNVRTGEPVEIGIVMAGRQTLIKGFILNASYHHSVNDASKMSMSLICRYADFE